MKLIDADKLICELDAMVDIEAITDSSGDTIGYVSDYDRGLVDAINVIQSVLEKEQEPKTDILDKIRAEIETQEKWLAQAGYNAYNVDIAFNSIKLLLAEMESEE